MFSLNTPLVKSNYNVYDFTMELFNDIANPKIVCQFLTTVVFEMEGATRAVKS